MQANATGPGMHELVVTAARWTPWPEYVHGQQFNWHAYCASVDPRAQVMPVSCMEACFHTDQLVADWQALLPGLVVCCLPGPRSASPAADVAKVVATAMRGRHLGVAGWQKVWPPEATCWLREVATHAVRVYAAVNAVGLLVVWCERLGAALAALR